MAAYLNLTTTELVALALITFAAGLVRGFSGFALSAIVMATAVLILPPIELIPMLWWLEMTASLVMFKGGWADADRTTAYALVIGSTLGWPIGLTLTMSLPVETSKMVALATIILLAATLLARVRLSALASRPGLYATGIVAGIVSGLANVGGMVVALYVLATDAPARTMRGSLVLFLLLGAIASMIVQLLWGVMDLSGIRRGLALALPTALGVVIGQRLFIPRLEAWYRPFCLTLLLGLASTGLIRLAVT